MQTQVIGLLHGMSRVATAEYYRLLNDAVQRREGGHAAAELLLFSVDFAKIERFVHTGDWAAADRYLSEGARRLEAGGADFVMLGTNTMHRCAPAITAALGVPFLDLVDVTIAEAVRRGVTRAGVLGTRATMEAPFYRDRLAAAGLRVITPGVEDRELIDELTFEHLCRGDVSQELRAAFARVADGLLEAGADGLLLACTEHGLVLSQEQRPDVPVLDTTILHVEAAIDVAFASDPSADPQLETGRVGRVRRADEQVRTHQGSELR